MDKNSMQATRGRLASALRASLVLGWLGVSGSSMAVDAPVTKPTVLWLESVATDAGIGANRSVPNSWGGHQPRITRHADGTVRVLYLVQRADATMEWRLMRRTPAGVWSKEASGLTVDDVGLVRDARNDLAYVVAWPNSVPTVYAGPGYAPAVIPGSWQYMVGGRHYGNIGIATDGTLCLKVSREFSTLPMTSDTQTEYSCGVYTPGAPAATAWKWSPMITKKIGARHSYDYLFPNPKGLAAGLYGFSQADVYKDAANLPALDPTVFPYVFNGILAYSTATTQLNWKQADAVKPLVKTSTVVAAPPTLRMVDGFMDSKQRVFSSFYQDDPLNAALRARRISVTTANGAPITVIEGGTVLPSYGTNRVFEDAKGRLWVLWSARALQITYVRIYPLIEAPSAAGSTAPSNKFSFGAYTDLSSSFYPNVIDGNIYVAVIRGGTSPANYVDLVYPACKLQYSAAGNIDQSLCYNADNSGLQRVLYARIRLPD